MKKKLKEQVVKFNLYTFEILFRHENTLKPITNLNLLQTYRGKVYSKQTNHEGKILVKAMLGFDLQYKLRNGKYLITIKVDKNKNLRVIDVNSKVIEQAATDLKSKPNNDSKPVESSKTSDANKSQKPEESKDTTSKRDQKESTSSEGHPKTKVTDNSEVIFIVETYDKKTNKLFSGGNYSIEYAGKKRNHVSGTHGVGKKNHKGKANEDIKITITNAGKESIIFTGKISKDMKPIELKIEKPSLELSGAHWYSRFMSSKNLADLDEPFGSNIRKFINCLKAAGITVVINTTHRPDARGYLMYYSTMIKRGIVDPDNVPPWEGVDIDWSHEGDKNKARKAASEMHAKYGIGNNKIAKPGRSNHNPKKALAVDMSITNFINKIVNYNGKSKKITSFSDLSAVGKEFNVYWFGSSDKPHWSHNGK